MRAHSEEVEQAFTARMRSGIDSPIDAEVMAGIGPAAFDSVSAMIESFEQGDEWTPTLPPGLTAAIRYSARHDVPLELLMRSVTIMGSVFVEFLVGKLNESEAVLVMQYIATWQSRNLDRVLGLFAAEYADELERLNRSPTRALGERVERLLTGGSEDAATLEYQLDAWHIGLVVTGEKMDLVCRRLAETLGCDILIVPGGGEDTLWAWLGAPRQIQFSEFEQSALTTAAALRIGAGEPRDGIKGWRLTHQEALAALPVAKLEGQGVVRYSNVSLLASALCDEATGRSLLDRYLKPLDRHRDARDLRKTLRVYFDLSCNAVSTASALGVNRHTIQRRLKRVEEAIGEPASARQAEFGVALRLEELTGRTRSTVS